MTARLAQQVHQRFVEMRSEAGPTALHRQTQAEQRRLQLAVGGGGALLRGKQALVLLRRRFTARGLSAAFPICAASFQRLFFGVHLLKKDIFFFLGDQGEYNLQ